MPVQFGDLPPRTSGTALHAWADVAAELKAHPHQWAVIHTDTTSHDNARNLTHRIRHGLVAAFRPAGAFEAATRGNDVWARYVGDKATP